MFVLLQKVKSEEEAADAFFFLVECVPTSKYNWNLLNSNDFIQILGFGFVFFVESDKTSANGTGSSSENGIC